MPFTKDLLSTVKKDTVSNGFHVDKLSKLMSEEYKLSTYVCHELNYNQIVLSVIDDYTIWIILNSPKIK